jgi:hypothetical protein
LLGCRPLSKSSFFVFSFYNKKGNKFRRLEKRGKSVDMIALKNKDDDEPTNTGTGCGLLPRKEVNLL